MSKKIFYLHYVAFLINLIFFLSDRVKMRAPDIVSLLSRDSPHPRVSLTPTEDRHPITKDRDDETRYREPLDRIIFHFRL